MGPIRNINHPTDGDWVPAPTSIMTAGAPYPQKSRRKRNAYTLPGDHPSSPSDSGYASGYISTPECQETDVDPESRPSPKSPTVGIRQLTITKDDLSPSNLQMNLDGNLSESDDPFRGGGSRVLEELAPSPPVAHRRASGEKVTDNKKSATLPRYSRNRPRPAFPAFLSSDSRVRTQHHGLEPSLSRAASTRHLDRFIPVRMDKTDSTAEIFRTAKSEHELTKAEKLVRHHRAAEDAFCFPRRVVTPMVTTQVPTEDFVAGRSWIRVGRVLGPVDQNTRPSDVERQVSVGSVWAVGGIAPGAVNNGHGQLVSSQTNARLFRTTFSTEKLKHDEEIEKHGARVATALGIDRTSRVLKNILTDAPEQRFTKTPLHTRTQWNGTEWVKEGSLTNFHKSHELRPLPAAPFKVLDAPNLRDDFYCSILAYSGFTNTLACGLGNLLYAWSDTDGVRLLNRGVSQSSDRRESHITSVAFSSEHGEKAILAYARSNGTLELLSIPDAAVEPASPGSSSCVIPRMNLPQPESSVSCLAWKPTTTTWPSRNPYTPGRPVETEMLLVGNEKGTVYLYSVEWPDRWEIERDNWPGCFSILATISNHSQQICGLAWSPNGECFATGGNDNLCHLFTASRVIEATKALGNITDTDHENPVFRRITDTWQPTGRHSGFRVNGTFEHYIKPLPAGFGKFRWHHGAAVKAIAFCPWQEGLVATGGGSNDKCIHFFHTTSGAPLATISVSAQVTSLIWSTSRREIAATFGYAQPEHPVRIAVFSWPDCRQVATIPWSSEQRALYAIPYPCRPVEPRTRTRAPVPARASARADGDLAASDCKVGRNETGNSEVGNSEVGNRKSPRGPRSRPSMEGCIVVASSDKSVKFHEIWPADSKIRAGKVGILGGSDILEGLEGIERDEAVIR
ncbi:WD domain-protein [Cladorrhinum sp. PSN332]|nr:WD domain-protein [Cladorrhinum sp. PSN332]